MIERLSFGFQNPNHAAAMLCAWLPLCWQWGRGAWLGKILVGEMFAMLLLTQSRTGLLVVGAEAAAWWCKRGMSGDAGTRRPRPLKVLALDLEGQVRRAKLG